MRRTGRFTPLRWRMAMPSRIAFNNAARVIGQKVHKTRPCDLCGTFAGVFITWAVPLDAGGQESGWNLTSMCNPCRRLRKRKHLNPHYEDSNESDSVNDMRRCVEVNGKVFAGVKEAAEFNNVSRVTIYNWLRNGRNGAKYVNAAVRRGRKVMIHNRVFSDAIAAARHMGVSKQTIYSWIKAGHTWIAYVDRIEGGAVHA